MIITSCEHIASRKVIKTIGLVKGNTIRARHIGRDIAAALRGIIGGEIMEYTKLIAEAREQAIDRMIADATAKGANAIIMVRFGTSEIMKGAAELLAYGTAIVIEEE
jgi:uncharacterized protein YbjQ (UPF0145 family)